MSITWLANLRWTPANQALSSLLLVFFVLLFNPIYSKEKQQLPSGNQTWQWKMDHLSSCISDFPIKTFIQRGFSFAMFDYKRVSHSYLASSSPISVSDQGLSRSRAIFPCRDLGLGHCNCANQASHAKLQSPTPIQ